VNKIYEAPSCTVFYILLLPRVFKLKIFSSLSYSQHPLSMFFRYDETKFPTHTKQRVKP